MLFIRKFFVQNQEARIVEQEGSVTLPGQRLKVVVHSRKGFSVADSEKHETAIGMLEEVLNSVDFKQRFLAVDYSYLPKGKTKEKIYKQIMCGSETLSPEEDFEIDVWVEMYYENNRVVGWTTPKSIWTNLNSKFFKIYSYEEVACNLFHEWLHKLGLDHASASDYNSVPYSAGYLVEKMIKEMKKGKKFTPINSVPTVEPKPAPVPTPVIVPAPTAPVEVPAPEKVLVCRRTWFTLFLGKTCRYE